VHVLETFFLPFLFRNLQNDLDGMRKISFCRRNPQRRFSMTEFLFFLFQRFDTNEEMVAHQAKHLTESKYKCELCGKHFPSQSSVWKHTKAHSGERPFVW
jgi:uncharacterized Zn-finger protein